MSRPACAQRVKEAAQGASACTCTTACTTHFCPSKNGTQQTSKLEEIAAKCQVSTAHAQGENPLLCFLLLRLRDDQLGSSLHNKEKTFHSTAMINQLSQACFLSSVNCQQLFQHWTHMQCENGSLLAASDAASSSAAADQGNNLRCNWMEHTNVLNNDFARQNNNLLSRVQTSWLFRADKLSFLHGWTIFEIWQLKCCHLMIWMHADAFWLLLTVAGVLTVACCP